MGYVISYNLFESKHLMSEMYSGIINDLNDILLDVNDLGFYSNVYIETSNEGVIKVPHLIVVIGSSSNYDTKRYFTVDDIDSISESLLRVFDYMESSQVVFEVDPKVNLDNLNYSHFDKSTLTSEISLGTFKHGVLDNNRLYRYTHIRFSFRLDRGNKLKAKRHIKIKRLDESFSESLLDAKEVFYDLMDTLGDDVVFIKRGSVSTRKRFKSDDTQSISVSIQLKLSNIEDKFPNVDLSYKSFIVPDGFSDDIEIALKRCMDIGFKPIVHVSYIMVSKRSIKHGYTNVLENTHRFSSEDFDLDKFKDFIDKVGNRLRGIRILLSK